MYQKDENILQISQVVGNFSHEKRKLFHKNGNLFTFLDLFPFKLWDILIFPNKLDISATKQKELFPILHWKNSIAKRTIFWSSEPENIAIRPMLRYGPQNYTNIGETAIQVRWYDNTMYSDCKQNIMPSLSLFSIFACDKTIRDTQKWSFNR